MKELQSVQHEEERVGISQPIVYASKNTVSKSTYTRHKTNGNSVVVDSPKPGDAMSNECSFSPNQVSPGYADTLEGTVEDAVVHEGNLDEGDFAENDLPILEPILSNVESIYDVSDVSINEVVSVFHI